MPLPSAPGPSAPEADAEADADADTVLPVTSGPTLREGAFGNATALSCRECGHQVELGPHYACPECFGPLEIAYDFPRVTREQIEAGPRNIWRYKALLPVPDDIETSPNTEPGFTRLLPAQNLAADLGLARLWVKDDSTNPTNSFKDRVVACALSAAREFGSKVFACPSTGNLANAVAAAGARALEARYPGVGFVLQICPPFRALATGEVANHHAAIAAARPEVVLVALGCPRQERFAAEHFDAAPGRTPPWRR